MGPDSLSLGEEAVWMQYGCVCVNTVQDQWHLGSGSSLEDLGLKFQLRRVWVLRS